jgi:hypothetical protein
MNRLYYMVTTSWRTRTTISLLDPFLTQTMGNRIVTPWTWESHGRVQPLNVTSVTMGLIAARLRILPNGRCLPPLATPLTFAMPICRRFHVMKMGKAAGTILMAAIPANQETISRQSGGNFPLP